MEPLVAISLAGNVLQFIDFGCTLCKTFCEIRQNANGLTKENAQRTALRFMNSLTTTAQSLQQHTESLRHESSLYDTCDLRIGQIISECMEVAEELLLTIEKLQPKARSGTLERFVLAIKTLVNEKQVKVLESRLDGLRLDFVQRMVVLIYTRIDLTEARRQDQFDKISAVQEEILETIRKNTRNSSQSPTEFQNSAPGLQTSSDQNPQNSSSLSIAVKELATWLCSRESDCIQSLSFPMIQDREDEISVAELKTFDWIFKNPREQSKSWSNFGRWLLDNPESQNIFWISGKAGSGKSTLMKYISHHKITLRKLKSWAPSSEETELIITRFFFWNSGNSLQKSQEGLFRTILLDCLSGHRELIPEVIPDFIKLNPYERQHYWTHIHLTRAWKRLISQTTVKLKICLFIDGLDEYEGGDDVIAQLVENVKNYPNIKVCVSSRPHIAFEKAFGRGQKLELQHLTFEDILVYVSNRLEHHSRMADLECMEPGFTFWIIKAVVDKASWVFLWVKLVVQSLIEGLDNGDPPEDLETRLEEFPEELEQLYQHMLDRVKRPGYKQEGLRLLLLVKYSQRTVGITLFQLFLAQFGPADYNNDEDPVFIPRDKLLERLSNEKLERHCSSLEARIKSRCLGLLEVAKPKLSSNERVGHQKVDFLHKSVTDFLDTMDESEVISNKFSPAKSLMRSAILELKLFPYQPIKRKEWFKVIRPKVCEFLDWAKFEENRCNKAEIPLVDELRLTADVLWSCVDSRMTAEKNGKHHWAAAPKHPGMASRKPDTSGNNTSWDIPPFGIPSKIDSFEMFAEQAGLVFYVAAKQKLSGESLTRVALESSKHTPLRATSKSRRVEDADSSSGIEFDSSSEGRAEDRHADMPNSSQTPRSNNESGQRKWNITDDRRIDRHRRTSHYSDISDSDVYSTDEYLDTSDSDGYFTDEYSGGISVDKHRGFRYWINRILFGRR